MRCRLKTKKQTENQDAINKTNVSVKQLFKFYHLFYGFTCQILCTWFTEAHTEMGARMQYLIHFVERDF